MKKEMKNNKKISKMKSEKWNERWHVVCPVINGIMTCSAPKWNIYIPIKCFNN